MFNATSTYLTKIKEASRIVSAKVDINGTVITEDLLINFSIESSMGSNRMPTIGSSIATKLNLSLVKDASIPAILINVPIKPYVGIEISTGVVEWIALGVFYANVGDVIRNKKTIDFECFDRMPDLDVIEYTSTLTFPATIQQMISEIATQHSIVFETQTLPTVSFDTKPEGTLRQVITYIASLISRNVVVNRTGKFEFRFTNVIPSATFTFNGDSYVDFSLLSDSMVKISQLSVRVSEDTSIVSGDATGISLVFENPAITSQAILDTVLARAYPLTFNAYSMTCQGFPHVDCGDAIVFTDVDNVVRTIIIGEHKLIYSGGLKSEFKCEAPKEESKDVTITSGSAIKHAVKNFAKTFEGAIKNATNLITGNEGGDLIILSDVNGKPYELVILGDTPVGQVGDIDTAMKVWRWNAGGLGYSNTGYNGSYATAITSDGQINADFIITGEMSATLVRTGLLSSEDGKSWFNLTDGKFSFANGAIAYNGTTLTIGADVDLTSNNSINTKVNEVQGIGKWLIRMYDIPTQGSAGKTITMNVLNGKTAYKIFEETDLATSYLNEYGSLYVGLATTFIHVSIDTTYDGQITTDDEGAVYVNGVLVKQSVSCQPIAISFALKKGWNQVDVLWGEGSGSDGFNFTPKFVNAFTATGDKIACYLNINGIPENRMASAETNISTVTQTANDVKYNFERQVIGGVNHFGETTNFAYVYGDGGTAYRSTDAPRGFYALGTNSAVGTRGTVRIDNVIDSNGYWTVSFWGKSNGDGVTFALDCADATPQTVTLRNFFTKHSYTFNVQNYDTVPSVYNFVDFAELGWAYYYFKDLKIEKGTVATDWSPHPDELYTGITTVNRDGINVGISTSDINTQITHTGLSILDGTKSLASFGENEALIPTLRATNVYADNIVNTISTDTYLRIGNGHPYTSVEQALTALGNNKKILKNGASLMLEIHSNISEDIIISGFSGDGQVAICFFNGATVNGKILLRNNSSYVAVTGIGSFGTVKYSGNLWVIDASSSLSVEIMNMNLSGLGSGQTSGGVMARNNSRVHVRGVDFTKLSHCIQATAGGQVYAMATLGGGAGSENAWYVYAYNGGVVYVTGNYPVVGNTIAVDNSWCHQSLGAQIPSNYSPPNAVDQTFTSTFSPASIWTYSVSLGGQTSYYGATAAQNRYDTSTGLMKGKIEFGSNLYNYIADRKAGTTPTVQMRVRRLNSSHGSNYAPTMPSPTPENFTPSPAFGQVARGAWSNWVSIPYTLIGSGGFTFSFYNGTTGNSYSIWDACEVSVTKVKTV